MVLFKTHLLALVLQGRKTQTRRTSRYELTVGRIYTVKTNLYGQPQGYIKITQKYRQRLGDVSEPEAKAEGFNSIEEFQKAWKAINGSWNPEQIVTAYEFELVEGRGSSRRR
jgi:hypothetical protein